MRTTVVTVDDRAGREQVYRELLEPSFPANELSTLSAFLEAPSDVVALVDPDAKPLAVAVGDVDPDAGVVLLSWLATARAARGTGLGSVVLREALTSWQQRWQPTLVLAEVEHPSLPASAAHGDPRARVRFYHRFGGRALDLPYFQPPVREGADRVFGLMLVALAHEGRPPAARPLPGAPVADFLRHSMASEPRDVAVRALLDAASTDWIETIGLDAPDEALPRTVG